MTGIELERKPNIYIIKVLRRGKCIDWVSYSNVNEMVSWFNCLSFMKYGKTITDNGKRLFRRKIACNVYEWGREDAYMKKANELYRNSITK